MFSTLMALFLLPYLDTSRIKSGLFRPVYTVALSFFAITVILLGWVGGLAVEEPCVLFGVALTCYYFGFLLVIIPVCFLKIFFL